MCSWTPECRWTGELQITKRSWWRSAAVWCSHWWLITAPVHMSARCISSHVDTHLPCQQSKRVNLTTKACDRVERRALLTITHTHTPVIFSALMLCCLCHRLFCTPTYPHHLHHICHCITQRRTVYISAKLALPSLARSLAHTHYALTLQAFFSQTVSPTENMAATSAVSDFTTGFNVSSSSLFLLISCSALALFQVSALPVGFVVEKLQQVRSQSKMAAPCIDSE